MFYPGETITHSFSVPFEPDDIAEVIVTYKQRDHIILVKEVTDDFEPIYKEDDDPEPEPEGNILVVISGAEVSNTTLIINPSAPGPEPPPREIIGSSFDIVFTQEESLLFDEGCYEAQINVLTAEEDRFTSGVMRGKVGEQHVRMVMAVEES